jgi:hypothetical protein
VQGMWWGVTGAEEIKAAYGRVRPAHPEPTGLRRIKLKVNMLECPACLGWHAHWWFGTTPAPSCAERQKGNRATA